MASAQQLSNTAATAAPISTSCPHHFQALIQPSLLQLSSTLLLPASASSRSVTASAWHTGVAQVVELHLAAQLVRRVTQRGSGLARALLLQHRHVVDVPLSAPARRSWASSW
jgi:hypothetical protein